MGTDQVSKVRFVLYDAACDAECSGTIFETIIQLLMGFNEFFIHHNSIWIDISESEHACMCVLSRGDHQCVI